MAPRFEEHKPLHILFVSHYLPPHLGGIEFVMGELSERLVSRGHRVTLIASSNGNSPGIESRENKTLIGVPAIQVLKKYSIPFPLFNPKALRRTLARVLETVDAVHIHGMLYMSSVLAARMASRRGIPVVLTEHVGSIPYDHRVFDSVQKLACQTLGRLTCHHSDVATVLNQRVEREIRPLLRPDTGVTRVPNGVDVDLFRPAAKGERARLRRKYGFEKPVALFVGRFVKKKGIDLLLEAANPELELVLCGTGSQIPPQPGTRILGLVDQATLAEVYRAADVLVLPSEGEGFPLVVQEALASGLPVVVTDNEANHEYLDETVAVFTSRSPDAIRENTLSLLRSPDRRRRMGTAGRMWAVRYFDWEQSVDRYLELYRRPGFRHRKA